MKITALLALFLASQTALAEKKFVPILQYGYEAGIYNTAGSGEFLEAGVGYRHNKKQETRLLLGYKGYSVVTGNEADIRTTTFKVILVYKVNERYSFGSGLDIHLSPKYSRSFSSDERYKHAIGPILQFEYNYNPRSIFGIRYTIMDYEHENVGAEFDANSVGFYFRGGW